MDDETIKALQAKYTADLQRELAKPPTPDPHRRKYRQFTRQLLDARLKAHLTQAELAARAGLQQPAIARIESGRGNPSLHTLLAITKALNVDLMLKWR
jgi:DNA-binding XRE family transcriptional regulator